MKKIGLIGGMSWESSSHYYQLINRMVREKMGGLHSAECLMYSVDFATIEPLMRNGEWDRIGKRIGEIALMLEKAGVDVVLICTNTIHKVAGRVQDCLNVPLIHIADPAAEKIKAAGIAKAGLLGTRFTMEEDFYAGRLLKKHGLETVVPEKEDRDLVDRVIFDELCRGKMEEDSRVAFIRIIDDLVEKGAGGVVLGCTEIGLLVSPEDVSTPLFDTSELHAAAAVEFALSL